jgi:hypothetical protein
MVLSTSADADQQAWPRSPWRQAVLSGSLIWLSVKSFVSLVSLIVVVLRHGPAATDPAGHSLPPLTGSGFFGALHHWDSAYFLSIAGNGYFPPGAGSSVQAFFPGFPLLSRAASDALTLGASTEVSLVVAMWLVGGLASLGATIVLYRLADERDRLADERAGERVATLTALLFLAGPYSVFLFANYSESLFLLFAVAAWYCGLRDRWQLVGMFAAAATFTRINGVFLVAALLVMYVVRRRRAGLPVATRTLCWLPVACAGIAGYFLYLLIRTGDPVAWLHAQGAGWGRGFSWPWEAFYQTAGRVLFASTVDRRLQFGLDIVFVAAIALAIIVFLRRRQWPEVTYLGLTVLAFSTSFTFVSAARGSVTLFPIVILAAQTILGGRSKAFRVVLLGAWLTLFVVNTLLFANGFWTD